MTSEQILSFVGAIGLGSLLGICIKAIFDSRQETKKLLFEARVKAFTGITARLTNLFLEPDMSQLPEEIFFVKLNHILSETMLIGSNKLNQLLVEYRQNLMNFHKELDLGKKDKKHSDHAAGELHKKLVLLVSKILNQMRKDLFVEGITWN